MSGSPEGAPADSHVGHGCSAHSHSHEHSHAHAEAPRRQRELPRAGERPFRVLLRGRNVIASHPLHEGQGARLGFWATCFVAATDEDHAGRVAFDLLYEDEELRAAVRNPAGSPPGVDVESVDPVEGFPCDRSVRYEWFDDHGAAIGLPSGPEPMPRADEGVSRGGAGA